MSLTVPWTIEMGETLTIVTPSALKTMSNMFFQSLPINPKTEQETRKENWDKLLCYLDSQRTKRPTYIEFPMYRLDITLWNESAFADLFLDCGRVTLISTISSFRIKPPTLITLHHYTFYLKTQTEAAQIIRTIQAY